MKEYGERRGYGSTGEKAGKHVLDCNGSPIYAGSYVHMTYANKTKRVAQVFVEGEAFELESGAVIDCEKSEKILYQDGGWDKATSVYVVNGTMSDALGIISYLERKNKRLKVENEQLEAKIERLKSEVPGDCMRLPLDADGVPIHIGNTVYAHDGSEFRVRSITFGNAGCAVGVKLWESHNFSMHIEPERLSHRAPEPPDSWEKLEKDALKLQCHYFGVIEDRRVDCENCPHGMRTTGRLCRDNMQTELIERAKRLAGIEEQEGE